MKREALRSRRSLEKATNIFLLAKNLFRASSFMIWFTISYTTFYCFYTLLSYLFLIRFYIIFHYAFQDWNKRFFSVPCHGFWIQIWNYSVWWIDAFSWFFWYHGGRTKTDLLFLIANYFQKFSSLHTTKLGEGELSRLLPHSKAAYCYAAAFEVWELLEPSALLHCWVQWGCFCKLSRHLSTKALANVNSIFGYYQKYFSLHLHPQWPSRWRGSGSSSPRNGLLAS